MMRLEEYVVQLEGRAAECEGIGATAPISAVYRQIAEELQGIQVAGVHPDRPAWGELGASGDDLVDTHRMVTWREKLWTVPDETRIGRVELLEALGRPASWLYRHTSPRAECSRIPHRKLDGELVFVVGEIRQWLDEHEEMVVPGRTTLLTVLPHRKGAA